jgi:hypothetical protein
MDHAKMKTIEYDDEESVSAIVEVFLAIQEKEMSGLTLEEKNLLSLYLWDTEVRNGGAHQFLCNSSGTYFHVLKSFLLEVNACQTLSIISEVEKLFPNGKIATNPQALSDACITLLDDDQKMTQFGQLADQYCRQSEDLFFIGFEYIKTSQKLSALMDDSYFD